MNGKCPKDDGESHALSAVEPDAFISVHRKLYTQDFLDSEYCEYKPVSPSLKDRLQNIFSCNLHSATRLILGVFPLVGILRSYLWRSDVVSDLISGVAVSFLQMPQGLALGLLASVPAVYGLYSTLYPVLIYLIFGTCRHMSMGTNAVLSLITAGIVEREVKMYMEKHAEGTSYTILDSETSDNIAFGPESITQSPSTLSEEELVSFKVGVATAVTFLSGAFLLAMGLLRVGFLTNYMSPSFVRGFTTASAVHIATSQLPRMLNIDVPAHLGPGKVIKTYVDIFSNIGDSNPADVVVSALSLAFLLGVTILVNERYHHKLRVPVPLELIIVVVSTCVSHFGRLEDRYGIAVVGDIPSGLPPPALPDMEVMGRIAVDSFVMAILIFTLTITLAKLMAEIYEYTVDSNRELLAYGMCNFLSSFFLCIPSCTAPPRTLILCNTGARSTLHGAVTVAFILLVILVAGRLFVSLPVAVLAVMIATAVKNLLLQVKQLPDLWRLSKPDFLVWVVTFATGVLLDIDIAIAVGLGISVFLVIVRSQLASGAVGKLSSLEDLVLFGNKNSKRLEEKKEFKMFYFPSQLFFANTERFAKELFSKTINPLLVDDSMSDRDEELKPVAGNQSTLSEDSAADSVKYVVLECSAMTYMDVAGASTMKRVAIQFQKVGVTLLLAKCPISTFKLLDSSGYFKVMDRGTVFHDVYDAVTYILQAGA